MPYVWKPMPGVLEAAEDALVAGETLLLKLIAVYDEEWYESSEQIKEPYEMESRDGQPDDMYFITQASAVKELRRRLKLRGLGLHQAANYWGGMCLVAHPLDADEVAISSFPRARW